MAYYVPISYVRAIFSKMYKDYCSVSSMISCLLLKSFMNTVL
ncbi:hypothetical protein [Orientia tsutsugamushi]|nr:hypothetical protein [Orientia tsutsugamushi]